MGLVYKSQKNIITVLPEYVYMIKYENISYSSYLCGSIRFYDPDTSLFEFDNCVRWNKF